MGKIIFLLLFVFLKNNGLTQNINIQQKTYEYYLNINTAEDFLINGNSSKSLESYLLNFDENGILYFKDFILPFQVALGEGDTTTSVKLLNFLTYDYETTKTLISFFNKIKLDTNSIWYETVNSLIDSTSFKKSNTLKEYIDSMFVLDQIDREIVYDKVWFARNKEMRKWDENSKTRIDSIIKMIIDLDMTSESCLGFDLSYYQHKKFYTILYHYPNSFIEYNEFFVNWINSGKMHPRHFAWVADFYEKHRNKNKRLSKSLFSYGLFASLSPKFKTDDFPEVKINLINKQRLIIGLPSIEHDIRLRKYITKNKLISYFYLY